MPIPDDIKAMTWYHGTPSEAVFREIIADRRLEPGQTKTGGWLAPVPGRVYLAADPEYSLIYALGGQWMGSKMDEGYMDGGRYGHIFVVRGADLTGDIQPDEDAVGEMVGDGDIPWLNELAKRRLTANMLRGVKGGEYIYYAKAGKNLLKVMTDEQKYDLIRRGAAISHAGPVKYRGCYQVDKERSQEFAPISYPKDPAQAAAEHAARVEKMWSLVTKVGVSGTGRGYWNLPGSPHVGNPGGQGGSRPRGETEDIKSYPAPHVGNPGHHGGSRPRDGADVAQVAPTIPSLTERAIAEFGITYDKREAGYILADGRMLDFSGKREGGEARKRSYDHRDIGRAFTDDELAALPHESNSEAMHAFMRQEGALRWGLYNNGRDTSADINVLVGMRLSAAQQRHLRGIIGTGLVTVSVSDERGYDVWQEYYEPFKPRDLETVLNRINELAVEYDAAQSEKSYPAPHSGLRGHWGGSAPRDAAGAGPAATGETVAFTRAGLDRVLVDEVLAQYRLDRNSIHGPAHWARVLHNGLLLAEQTGARKDVVTLFALLHDSQRVDETENEHGPNAARYADELWRQGKLKVDRAGFDLLREAMRRHSENVTQGDVTVRTCWDADRLDLGRPGVGIMPNPRYLATDWGKRPEVIGAAYQRSQAAVGAKHYGPGDHPGTGTSQDVHDGDAASPSAQVDPWQQRTIERRQRAIKRVPRKYRSGFAVGLDLANDSVVVFGDGDVAAYCGRPQQQAFMKLFDFFHAPVGYDKNGVAQDRYHRALDVSSNGLYVYYLALEAGKDKVAAAVRDTLTKIKELGVTHNEDGAERVFAATSGAKHYGPGPHPGTNTPQSVHGGGAEPAASAAGVPDVLYHGTTAADFAEFRPGKPKRTMQLGFGIHFSEDETFCREFYAAGKRGRIVRVHLDIKSLLDADKIVYEGMPDFDLGDRLMRISHKRFPIVVRDEQGRRGMYLQTALDAASPQIAEREVRAAGYDGIRYQAKVISHDAAPGYYRQHGNATSYVVFEPRQIKILRDTPEIAQKADPLAADFAEFMQEIETKDAKAGPGRGYWSKPGEPHRGLPGQRGGSKPRNGSSEPSRECKGAFGDILRVTRYLPGDRIDAGILNKYATYLLDIDKGTIWVVQKLDPDTREVYDVTTHDGATGAIRETFGVNADNDHFVHGMVAKHLKLRLMGRVPEGVRVTGSSLKTSAFVAGGMLLDAGMSPDTPTWFMDSFQSEKPLRIARERLGDVKSYPAPHKGRRGKVGGSAPRDASPDIGTSPTFNGKASGGRRIAAWVPGVNEAPNWVKNVPHDPGPGYSFMFAPYRQILVSRGFSSHDEMHGVLRKATKVLPFDKYTVRGGVGGDMIQVYSALTPEGEVRGDEGHPDQRRFLLFLIEELGMPLDMTVQSGVHNGSLGGFLRKETERRNANAQSDKQYRQAVKSYPAPHLGNPGHHGGSRPRTSDASVTAEDARVDAAGYQGKPFWQMTQAEFCDPYPKAPEGWDVYYTITRGAPDAIRQQGLLKEKSTGYEGPKGALWATVGPFDYSDGGTLVMFKFKHGEPGVEYANHTDRMIWQDIPPADIMAIFESVPMPASLGYVPDNERYREDRARGRIGKRAHMFYVQSALDAGRPVPPEVLKDYPNLVPNVHPDTIPGNVKSYPDPHEGRPGKVGGSSPRAKQPWQMTFAEFMAFHVPSEGDNSANPDMIAEMRAEGLLSDYTDDDSIDEFLGRSEPEYNMSHLRERVKQNKPIWVYRATTTDAEGVIFPGAYVTPSKAYARDHGRNNLGGQKFRILSQRVRPDELVAMNPNEFFYAPKDLHEWHRLQVQRAVFSRRSLPAAVKAEYADTIRNAREVNRVMNAEAAERRKLAATKERGPGRGYWAPHVGREGGTGSAPRGESSDTTPAMRTMRRYHGTSAPYDISTANAVSASTNSATFGDLATVRHGIFLTDNPDMARAYGPHVMAVDVDLAATAKITNDLRLDFVDSIDAFAERDLWLLAKYAQHDWNLFDGEVGARFVAFLQGRGYDSAEFEEEIPTANGDTVAGKTLVVFDPVALHSAAEEIKSYPGPGHEGLPGHYGGSAPRRIGGGVRPPMYGGGGAVYADNAQSFEVDDRLTLTTPGLPELEVSYRGIGSRGVNGERQATVYDPKSGGQFVVPEANLHKIAPAKPAATGAELTAKLQEAIADTYFQTWWEDGANDDAELLRMSNEARAACDLPPLTEAEFAARRQKRRVDNPKLATAQYEFLKLCAEPNTPTGEPAARPAADAVSAPTSALHQVGFMPGTARDVTAVLRAGKLESATGLIFLRPSSAEALFSAAPEYADMVRVTLEGNPKLLRVDSRAELMQRLGLTGHTDDPAVARKVADKLRELGYAGYERTDFPELAILADVPHRVTGKAAVKSYPGPDHRGRPGKVGGSLPREAGAESATGLNAELQSIASLGLSTGTEWIYEFDAAGKVLGRWPGTERQVGVDADLPVARTIHYHPAPAPHSDADFASLVAHPTEQESYVVDGAGAVYLLRKGPAYKLHWGYPVALETVRGMLFDAIQPGPDKEDAYLAAVTQVAAELGLEFERAGNVKQAALSVR